MATRAIITHQPEVECDVCGRRLLRGERPDAFIDSGHRRIVCELCAPRAVGSGWTRESDALAAAEATPRSRGGRSLMGRFRTRRVSERERDDTGDRGAPHAGRAVSSEGDEVRGRGEGRRAERQPGAEPYDLDDDLGLSYEDAYAGGAETLSPADAELAEPRLGAGGETTSDRGDVLGEERELSDADAAEDALGVAAAGSTIGGYAGDGVTAADGVHASVEIANETALSHFNASEAAARVAGIARSLGEPEVTVRALDLDAQRVSIVVAWELCWYRYEVDMGAEAPLVTLSGDGMELDELPAEDRAGNARADERGELSLA